MLTAKITVTTFRRSLKHNQYECNYQPNLYSTHMPMIKGRESAMVWLLYYDTVGYYTEQHHLISARNKNIKRFSFTAAPHKKNLLKNLRQQQLLLKIT